MREQAEIAGGASLAAADHVKQSTRRLQSVLTREEVLVLSRPNSMRLVFDFSLVWCQALLGLATFACLNNILGFVIGLALVGSAQHGMGLVAHEGAHRLIVPKRS